MRPIVSHSAMFTSNGEPQHRAFRGKGHQLGTVIYWKRAWQMEVGNQMLGPLLDIVWKLASIHHYSCPNLSTLSPYFHMSSS